MLLVRARPPDLNRSATRGNLGEAEAGSCPEGAGGTAGGRGRRGRVVAWRGSPFCLLPGGRRSHHGQGLLRATGPGVLSGRFRGELAEKWGRGTCGPRVRGRCGVAWSGSGLAAVRTESLQSVGEEEGFGGGARVSFLVGERGDFGWR